MQEIAIILSSLAGAATAAFIVTATGARKSARCRAGGQDRADPGAVSPTRDRTVPLKIEREILTKSIARLHRQDSGLSREQKNRLLPRYQNQLEAVQAKIERIQQEGRDSGAGPAGDGLITIIDQRFSKLDDRLQELSSRMTDMGRRDEAGQSSQQQQQPQTQPQPPVSPTSQRPSRPQPSPQQRQQQQPQPQPPVSPQPRPPSPPPPPPPPPDTVMRGREEPQGPKPTAPADRPGIGSAGREGGPAAPPAAPRQPFELATLTSITQRRGGGAVRPRFALPDAAKDAGVTAQVPPQQDIAKKIRDASQATAADTDGGVKKPVVRDAVEQGAGAKKGTGAADPVPRPPAGGKDVGEEFARITRHKALPGPPPPQGKRAQDDDYGLDDDDYDEDMEDLDKLKKDIFKTLSKMEQAEME